MLRKQHKQHMQIAEDVEAESISLVSCTTYSLQFTILIVRELALHLYLQWQSSIMW